MVRGLLGRGPQQPVDTPDDLDVLDNGLAFVQDRDQLDYFWFETVERENGRAYRNFKVVRLAAMTYLPQEARQNAALVAKQRTALVGLYANQARFDLVHLVAGIFVQMPIGIVQCYGVASSEPSLELAQHQSRLGMAALRGVLANYPQSRFEPLDVKVSRWLMSSLLGMSHALVVIGHPDLRETARGGGRESPEEQGGPNKPAAGYGLQQNEMLFRGMAAQQEEFLWMALSHRISLDDVARMLAGVAGEASVWASRMSGSKGMNVLFSVPIMLSGAFSRAAGTGYGESEGRTAGQAVSRSEGQAHTEGQSETEGHSTSRGSSHTVGVAHTQGSSSGVAHTSTWSVSQGASQSQGAARSQGSSESWGEAHTQGQAVSHSSSVTHSASATHVPEVTSLSGSSTISGPDPDDPSRSITLNRPATMENSGISEPKNDPAVLQALAGGGGGQVPAAPAEPAPAAPEPAPGDVAIGASGAYNETAGGMPAVVPTLPPAPNVVPGIDSGPAVQALANGDVAGTFSVPGGSATASSNWSSGVSKGASLGMPGTAGANVGFQSSQGGGFARTGPLTPGAQIQVGQTETNGTNGPIGSPDAGAMPGMAAAALEGDFGQIPNGMGVGYQQQAGKMLSETTSESTTPAHTITSSSTSRSASSSVTNSASQTQSHNRGVSQSQSESRGQSTSQGRVRGGGTTTSSSSFSSSTQSESWGEFSSQTWSHASTRSQSDTESQGRSVSRAASVTGGQVIGRSLGLNRSMGISGGIVPSVSFTKSYNWMDDAAVQVAQLLRTQEEILRRASQEGAFLSDVYLLTRTEQGRAAAESLVRQAFHGTENVVTPVLTRCLGEQEQRYIRRHVSAFTPSTRIETIPGLLEGYKDATLLTADHLAAYTAPGLFEQGLAVTTQERIPPFAFYPDLEGEVVLGHQFIYETGQLTSTPVRLAEARHMHTAFIGDTGFGKTVAAERLCLETARHWHHRNVVLDFGAGWRRLLNSGLDKRRVDVWQLQPGAVRPLRWNPLQIGRRIDPVEQLRATSEIFAHAGQMGMRQMGMLRKSLKHLYVTNGVLTGDKEVQADRDWGRVRPGEESVIDRFRHEAGLPPRSVGQGTPLARLEPVELQALAVHRSKQVGVGDWYKEIQGYEARYKEQPGALESLEGLLLRLDIFVLGQMSVMYGKGEDAVAIEDLGLLGPPDDRWGIAVLEGGQRMDEYAKATLLGLIAWHLYYDAAARREQSIGGPRLPIMNIFWEEANKVLSGVAGTRGNGDRNPAQTSSHYRQMWQDGRKNFCFNHVMTQNPSELPPGVISSSNNCFICQTKGIPDREICMAQLAKSEKGFTDEEYKRYMSRIEQKTAICKLGYTDDVRKLEPMLVRALRVLGDEPSNAELLAWFQARDRQGQTVF